MDYNEFFEGSPYRYAFINLCCFIPVCIVSVYLFIYLLLPAFLTDKRNYLLFSFVFFSWFGFVLIINYFFAGLFLTNIHYKNYIEPDFIHKINFSYANTVWAITIALLSLAIKLSKNWYLQQRENLEIAKRKARIELRIQKAFIQPAFLFRTLDSISSKVDTSSEEPAAMILKLSDLLSYSLYQGDLEMAPLEKELACLNDFISLEQVNFGRSSKIDMRVNGYTTNKYIPPLAILALLQEIITMLISENLNSHQVSCQVNLENNHLIINMSFFSLRKNTLNSTNWSAIIQNTRSRLNLFYSQKEYKIEMTEEKGKTIMKLSIPLSGSPYRQRNDLDIQPNTFSYEPA
ncbi:MAG: histidine kinase [Chitinophagaceae bacterium]